MGTLLRTLRARVRALLRRDAVADEISEELRFHLEQRTSDFERQGFSHEDAERRARTRFGNLAKLHDESYDIRGGGFLETVWQDVRYAARILRRQPVFSAIAIATLGLGIGATAALFSVMDAAWLRPLPFPNPDQLFDAAVQVNTPKGPRNGQGASLQDARDWRAMPAVSNVALWSPDSRLIVDAGEPERVAGKRVDEGYFDLFGVAPMLGQHFTEQMTRPGAPAVVMLGHSYWRRRFNADAHVVGRDLRIGRGSATIIGVVPEGFEHAIDIWLPLNWPVTMRGFTAAYARLRDGVSRDQAEQEWAAQLEAGGWPSGASMRLTPLKDDVTRRSRTTINTLSGGVGLILLIACVNVAGLLLARGATRGPELAVRASIGAGRGRLIRQLLTESMVLALIGTAIGITIAWLSLDAIVALVPLELPSSVIPAVNGVVLGLTALTSVVTALVFGLVPARSLSRAAAQSLANGGHRQAGAPLSRKAGQTLIAIEFALAVVLLTGAGLLLRSFDRLLAVDLGFDPDAVIVMRVAPLNLTPESAQAFYPAFVDALRRLPGVEAAGAIDFVPLGGSSTRAQVDSADGTSESVDTQWILPGYFEALGISARAGRLFSQGERNPTGVILDEIAAAQLFPGGGAVGRTVTMMKTTYEVVGVVSHVKRWGALRDQHRPNIYRLVPTTHGGPLAVVVRHSPGVVIPADALRALVTSVGPPVLIDRIGSGTDLLDENVKIPRQRTILLSLLGGLGLLLTLVGIASVTAYAVARRTREIGVRIAFGAEPHTVVWTMMRDAAWPMALGLAAGLGASFYATKLVASFLYQTTPTDPLTFIAAAVLLVVASGVAAWLPARRAANVDPVRALRTE